MSSIFKNELYEVVIRHNDKEGKEMYHVDNVTTGVEEFVTTLMPEAIHYAIELKNDMDKLNDLVKAAEVTTLSH